MSRQPQPLSRADYALCPSCGENTTRWGRSIQTRARVALRSRECDCGRRYSVAVATLDDNIVLMNFLMDYFEEREGRAA